jgi:hypothetical protein
VVAATSIEQFRQHAVQHSGQLLFAVVSCGIPARTRSVHRGCPVTAPSVNGDRTNPRPAPSRRRGASAHRSGSTSPTPEERRKTDNTPSRIRCIRDRKRPDRCRSHSRSSPLGASTGLRRCMRQSTSLVPAGCSLEIRYLLGTPDCGGAGLTQARELYDIQRTTNHRNLTDNSVWGGELMATHYGVLTDSLGLYCRGLIRCLVRSR